jgi:tetratricopeptide (TPR) repeat protein
MCPSSESAGQSGGVNIHGQVGNVVGDIVGGNKGLDAKEVTELFARMIDSKGLVVGLPIPVARGIVEGFGEQAGVLDAEGIERALNQKAEDYRNLKERLDRLSNDDPAVQALRREASCLIDAGDFAAADARLADAEQRDLNSAIEQEENAKRKRLSAAASRGARGDAAMLHFAYRDAANHYAQAADISAPLEDVEERWGWLIRRADALVNQGQEFGDNSALQEAIAGFNLCLDLVPRARAARLGDDAEQSRHRALDARGAGERDGETGRGGRGLSRGAEGKDARARAARLGGDAEQSRQRAR